MLIGHLSGGRVEGNILTIEAKESDCNVEVEWLVTCTRRSRNINCQLWM